VAGRPYASRRFPSGASGGTPLLLSSGITAVQFRINKGPIKTAVGTTAWKLSAKLKPGKNTIEIVAEDAVGNLSAAKKVKVKRE
jgi:hypothetical protein